MGRGLAVRTDCQETRRGQGDRGINSERSAAERTVYAAKAP